MLEGVADFVEGERLEFGVEGLDPALRVEAEDVGAGLRLQSHQVRRQRRSLQHARVPRVQAPDARPTRYLQNWAVARVGRQSLGRELPRHLGGLKENAVLVVCGQVLLYESLDPGKRLLEVAGARLDCKELRGLAGDRVEEPHDLLADLLGLPEVFGKLLVDGVDELLEDLAL